MKKILLFILMSITALSALELHQMELDKLNPDNEYELHYQVTETVSKNKSKAKLKNASDIFILVKKTGERSREYQLTVQDPNQKDQQVQIEFTSPDGGETLEEISTLNPDGTKTTLTDKKELAEYKFLPDTGVKMDQSRPEKISYLFGKRPITVDVYSGKAKNSNLDEGGGLKLTIDSKLQEKLYLSKAKDLPVMVKSEFIIDNNRYASHAENPDIEFNFLKQEAQVVKTIELISAKSSGSNPQGSSGKPDNK